MIKIVCTYCNSENVMRDAYAEWDSTAQEWVLHSFYDNAYCNDCDDETSLEEIPLQCTSSSQDPVTTPTEDGTTSKDLHPL